MNNKRRKISSVEELAYIVQDGFYTVETKLEDVTEQVGELRELFKVRDRVERIERTLRARGINVEEIQV